MVGVVEDAVLLDDLVEGVDAVVGEDSLEVRSKVVRRVACLVMSRKVPPCSTVFTVHFLCHHVPYVAFPCVPNVFLASQLFVLPPLLR